MHPKARVSLLEVNLRRYIYTRPERSTGTPSCTAVVSSEIVSCELLVIHSETVWSCRRMYRNCLALLSNTWPNTLAITSDNPRVP